MRRVFILVLLGAVMLPMATSTVAAQGGDPCADALNGIAPDGYEIVWGSGSSGSQVVLGTDGDDWLEGGSGDDILCGFGGNDVLIGGSGSDYLDAGTGSNELYGESGHDTLIGMEADQFDGGSGSNEIAPIASGPTDCDIALSYRYPVSQPSLANLDLSGCILRESNLTNADLSGSDLTDAVLILANLTGANLSGATLTGVLWGDTTCPDGSNSGTGEDATCVGHLDPNP